jgi:hypothetical protein
VWGGRKHPKKELIRRFSAIDVKSIATWFRINTDKFDAYARETAQLYIDTYSWYEEAQEAKNKDFKFVREHHTRKISRISTNENLLHY